MSHDFHLGIHIDRWTVLGAGRVAANWTIFNQGQTTTSRVWFSGSVAHTTQDCKTVPAEFQRGDSSIRLVFNHVLHCPLRKSLILVLVYINKIKFWNFKMVSEIISIYQKQLLCIKSLQQLKLKNIQKAGCFCNSVVVGHKLSSNHSVNLKVLVD